MSSPRGGTGATFFTGIADLDAVNKALTEKGWQVSKTELGYVPKSMMDLSPEARKEVEQFLGDINDNDDVHRVYAGIR